MTPAGEDESVKASDRTILGWLREERFAILLLLLLSYIVLAPFFEDPVGQLIFRTTVGSFIFLAAIAALQVRKLRFLTFRWFGLLTLLSGLIPLATARPALLVTSALFRIVFFAIVTIVLIYQIAASREVTLGTIIGAIDGYLLLGFMAGAAFTINGIVSPGSLKSGSETLVGSDFLYYSFITLATVGYGDIVPVGAGARSIAILVAISGQLYVAILISVLVGKYLSARRTALPLDGE